MLLSKVCRCSIMFLSEYFIISFVILSKLGVFIVFKYLILSLISFIVVLWFKESIGLVLSSPENSCFVKLQFFVVDSFSVNLNHTMMGEFDIQVTYCLNFRWFVLIDSRILHYYKCINFQDFVVNFLSNFCFAFLHNALYLHFAL